MDHHPTSPVIELQISHRSIRRYTGEPIPDELLAALIRAGQGAASSSFIQAYSIIRVTRSPSELIRSQFPPPAAPQQSFQTSRRLPRR